jgi:hypothetical protein
VDLEKKERKGSSILSSNLSLDPETDFQSISYKGLPACLAARQKKEESKTKKSKV